MKKNLFRVLLITCLLLVVSSVYSQRRMEKLGRGIIALRQSSGVYVGWRMLGTESNDVTYNLYRSENDGTPVLVNATPIVATTDYLDKSANVAAKNVYTIKAIINGVEQAASAGFTLAANTSVGQFLSIPQTNFSDVYTTIEARPADVDGDGEFEYVVVRELVAGLPVPPSTLSNYIVQCYKLGVGCMWTIRLGVNLMKTSSINWYHMGVADFDGDGKAEVMLKTAEGTTFQYGTDNAVTIGDTNNDGKTDYRETNGWVITGPEFLSVVEGSTGKELARTDFKPSVKPDDSKTAYEYWGENERPFYLWTGVGFFDGVLPSFIATRGWDTDRQHVYTYDYRDGKITERWHFFNNFHVAEDGSALPANASLKGAHTIWIGDLDNDGKDDIDFLPWALNGDGKILYASDYVHGDHYRIADFDPDRPGLEHYLIQQYNPNLVGQALYEAATGKTIKKWFLTDNGDVSRGMAGDWDPRHKGLEIRSTMEGIWNCKGEKTADANTDDFFPTKEIWWDADLLRECISGANSTGTSPILEKVNYTAGSTTRLYSLYSEGVHQMYGGIAPYWGDVLGDWREEIVIETSDYSQLRIYSPVTSSTTRVYTLLQNPQYRANSSTKGRAGGQYTDYYLGVGMEVPAPPPITDATYLWNGSSANTVWQNGSDNFLDNSSRAETIYQDGGSVLFDLTGSTNTLITLEGDIVPSKVTVYSPIDYTFAGTGKLTGTMELTKVGKGTLTLNQKNDYTGKTEVWDGALIVNNTLEGSSVVVHGGTWGGYMATGLTGGRIGGTGTLNQSLIMTYGAAIVPGNGMNSAGKLTINGDVTERNYAVNCFDLSKNAEDATKNDLLYIKGNFTLPTDSTIFIIINPIDGVMDIATYTLIQYEGTFTGDLNNITVKGLEGTAYTLKNEDGKILLTIDATRHPANIVWKGGLDDNKWNMVKTENFLKNNTLTQFIPGDAVLFDKTGADNSIVTLVETLPVSSLVVNSSYVFNGDGNVSGTSSLVKNGLGTLTINTKNSYTGATIINDGILEVNNLNEAGSASAIGAASAETSNFIMNNATLRTSTTCYTNRGVTLTGANTFDVPNSGNVLTYQGLITGNSSLTKTGAGTLTINNTNSYTGGTIVKGGTLVLGSNTANISGIGSGSLTICNATINLFDARAYGQIAWGIVVPTGYSGTLYTDGTSTMLGSLTGGGTLNLYTTYTRSDLAGDWSGFEGTINVLNSHFRIKNAYGYAKATLNLNGNSVYRTTGGSNTSPTYASEFGALSGTGYLTAGNWTIGAKNINTTFAGVISATSLTKKGTGSLTLTGANTYTGATTINAGKLVIDGSLGATAVAVNSGATLDGNGTLGGAVTVNSGGTLAVGDGYGTLTVNNTVTLNANSKFNIEVNKATPAGEKLTATTVNLGNSTLVISNLGTAYAAGDAFTIVSGTINGTFSAIEPAQPAAGLAWDLSTISSGILGIKTTNAPSITTTITPNVTSANVTISSSRTGKIYYSLTDQTQSTITTNGIAIDVVAGVSTTFTLSLSENTAYNFYAVAVAESGDEPVSFVSKTAFATSAMLSASMSSVAVNTAVVSVSPSITGKVYYAVLLSSATAPTSAEVVAQSLSAVSKGSKNCTVSTSFTFDLSGLAASTAYKVYIVGNEGTKNSLSPIALSFTTQAALPAGSITLNSVGQTSVNVSVTPNVAGTVRFVVLKSSDAVPTADAIVSQDLGVVTSKNVACTANTAVTTNLDGLDAITAYTVYAVIINADSKLSSVLSVSTITYDFSPIAQVFLNKTSVTEAEFDLKSNVAGKLYYVLFNASNAEITADVVINPSSVNEVNWGNGNVVSVINEYETITLSNLKSFTNYQLYVVAENADGIYSPVASLAFTTKAKVSVETTSFDNEVKLFPNPANNSVTVSYALDKNTTVTGELYSVEGQKLQSIENTTVNAGKHSKTFDVSQLSSGVYFYQLRTSSRIITKKLIIRH